MSFNSEKFNLYQYLVQIGKMPAWFSVKKVVENAVEFDLSGSEMIQSSKRLKQRYVILTYKPNCDLGDVKEGKHIP
jgi:hypothetical protein